MGLRTVALSIAFAALAAATLLLSFLTWFRVDVVGQFAPTGTYPIRRSVDAWQGSSLWAAAALLAVVAALCGLVTTRLQSRHAAALSGGAGLAAAAGSALSWGRQWWLIEHPPRPSLAVAVRLGMYDGGHPVTAWALIFKIKRNQLADYAAYNRAGWHAYQTTSAALLGVTLVLIAVLLALTWVKPSVSGDRPLREAHAA